MLLAKPRRGPFVAGAWVVPGLAGVVSLGFAALVLWQYATRRRPHQLAWGLGILAYAVASLIEARVEAASWSVALYALYFPFASATVGLLGLGTVYLLRPGRWGARFAWATAVAILLAAAGPWIAGVDASALAGAGSELGAKPVPYPNPGRFAFLALNVVGGLALIGGALWSWRITRSPGVLLIGLGAVLPFLGGALASFTGYDDRLMMQFLGIAVMLAGYLRSREAPPRAESAATDPSAASAAR